MIAAISGHLSIREVQRYIAAADKRAMAKSGMALMEGAFSMRENKNKASQTLGASLQIGGKKP